MNDRLPGTLSDEEYLQRLRTKIAEKRVPYTGSIELTHRCNLKCVHCYLGDQSSISKGSGNELSTELWIGVIDQIVDAQCLDLLITGGEPMLRGDFPEIYAHAKRRGMIVTVFSNATLITPEILDIFDDLPPFFVEVSIYGATAGTHDRITQVKGSHAKCMKGVEVLLKLGVRVGLKTVLMSLNKHEYADMEKLARKLKVPWRLDSAVFPCLPNSDSGGQPNRCSLFTVDSGRKTAAKSPLSLRVDPQDAVALEFADEARVKAMRNTFVKMSGRKAAEKLYTCGAGLTGFHIDPYGYLQPCMMTTGYRQKLVGSSFQKAWREIGRVRDVPAPAGFACGACDKLSICSGCPALFDLENGAAGMRSEYICALTQFRYDSIQNAPG
jgi:radical SAM protein with 4Fe4S-binding SPASM domain